jgi:hypothetical protein
MVKNTNKKKISDPLQPDEEHYKLTSSIKPEHNVFNRKKMRKERKNQKKINH